MISSHFQQPDANFKLANRILWKLAAFWKLTVSISNPSYTLPLHSVTALTNKVLLDSWLIS